ncbi:MAG: hypothetical protein EOP46_14325 [Sphingobacteriaceae bacterium]|nr:MAG: hypothetical protein EOP46_14325 [Sphingobacteriaceae bacterium]
MKKITLIRLFAFFPFVGIVIPNAAFALNNNAYSIPLFQLLACMVLGLVILTSFAVQMFHPKFRSR